MTGMLVGPPWWRCVNADSIATPRGGLFGDVDRWKPVLAAHGLHLCWSVPNFVYAIYTEGPGGQPVFQLHLRNSRTLGPSPLTEELVFALITLRESDARQNKATLAQRLQDQYVQDDRDMQQNIRERNRVVAEEAVREAYHHMGITTRPVRVQMPGIA